MMFVECVGHDSTIFMREIYLRLHVSVEVSYEAELTPVSNINRQTLF
jgi:hypothetical protein